MRRTTGSGRGIRRISYLDHPPMVAYLIRLGTTLLGNTELGVRCLFGRDDRGIGIDPLAGRAAKLSPTPGRRSSFRWPCWRARWSRSSAPSPRRMPRPAFFKARRWQPCWEFSSEQAEAPPIALAGIFGIFMGLALDSKYTSVLLGMAVGLALLSVPEGRRQLLTPWPWLSAMLAAAVFAPVVYWNARHHWASFRFQIRHGITSERFCRLAKPAGLCRRPDRRFALPSCWAFA